MIFYNIKKWIPNLLHIVGWCEDGGSAWECEFLSPHARRHWRPRFSPFQGSWQPPSHLSGYGFQVWLFQRYPYRWFYLKILINYSKKLTEDIVANIFKLALRLSRVRIVWVSVSSRCCIMIASTSTLPVLWSGLWLLLALRRDCSHGFGCVAAPTRVRITRRLLLIDRLLPMMMVVVMMIDDLSRCKVRRG